MTGCLVNYIKYLKNQSHLPVNHRLEAELSSHIITDSHVQPANHKDQEAESDSDSSDFESCDGDNDLNERMRELDISRSSQVSR